MVEPSRSAGSRSGVNCTRVNRSPSAAAKDRAISVLPRPGRSSMSTWPRARTAVRMSVSAERFPTTTRSISSSTASHDVVWINPFPQFGAEKHLTGCVIRHRVLGLPLARCHFVSSREHRAQMPVPVRSGGVRPPDRRLGGGEPVAQRFPQIVVVRLGLGPLTLSQVTTDIEQHQSQGDPRGRQEEPAAVQYQRQQLYPHNEADTQGYQPFHTGLRNSARTSRSTSSATSRCPSFITCGEKRASSNRFTSRSALSACNAWCSTARTSTSVGVSNSWGSEER